MDNKEIISQLEKVVELLNQNKELQEEIDYKAMHSTMPMVEKLSKQTGSIKGIPNAIKSIPMPPVEDTVTEKTAILEKSKAKFRICSIAVIALFVIYIIAGEGFQSIISFPLIISGIVWLLAASKYNMSKNDLKKKKEEYSKKQEDNRKKLLAYEFIPVEYWEYSPFILKALKSGRADNYKEALNLVITEEREKTERIAQKEMQEMQARLLEKQAEEERRHNRQMELVQAEANRMQEAHYREMAYAQREKEKIEKKNSDSQMHVCFKCKHYGLAGPTTCRGGIVGCGSFTPK